MVNSSAHFVFSAGRQAIDPQHLGAFNVTLANLCKWSRWQGKTSNSAICKCVCVNELSLLAKSKDCGQKCSVADNACCILCSKTIKRLVLLCLGVYTNFTCTSAHAFTLLLQFSNHFISLLLILSAHTDRPTDIATDQQFSLLYITKHTHTHTLVTMKFPLALSCCAPSSMQR